MSLQELGQPVAPRAVLKRTRAGNFRRTRFGDSQASILVAPDGMLAYRYRAVAHDPGVSCSFHLLSEVGARYQPDFTALIEEHGLKIERSRTIDHAPWVADFAVS